MPHRHGQTSSPVMRCQLVQPAAELGQHFLEVLRGGLLLGFSEHGGPTAGPVQHAFKMAQWARAVATKHRRGRNDDGVRCLPKPFGKVAQVPESKQGAPGRG